jgi:hypothetical protein
MTAASTYRSGYCPGDSGSSRGGAGVGEGRSTRLGATAHAVARAWAEAGYATGVKGASVRLSKARSVHVAGAHAVEVDATVTLPKHIKCGSPTGIVDAVAVSGVGSVGVFVLYADQGVASAPSPTVIKRMVGSVRRIP